MPKLQYNKFNKTYRVLNDDGTSKSFSKEDKARAHLSKLNEEILFKGMTKAEISQMKFKDPEKYGVPTALDSLRYKEPKSTRLTEKELKLQAIENIRRDGGTLKDSIYAGIKIPDITPPKEKTQKQIYDKRKEELDFILMSPDISDEERDKYDIERENLDKNRVNQLLGKLNPQSKSAPKKTKRKRVPIPPNKLYDSLDRNIRDDVMRLKTTIMQDEGLKSRDAREKALYQMLKSGEIGVNPEDATNFIYNYENK